MQKMRPAQTGHMVFTELVPHFVRIEMKLRTGLTGSGISSCVRDKVGFGEHSCDGYR
jgi:hypothetical protein